MRAAVQRSPDHAEPVVDLAQLLVRTDRGDQALSLLEKFTTRQPGNFPALNALFDVQMARKDFAAARHTAQRVQTVKPGEVDATSYFTGANHPPPSVTTRSPSRSDRIWRATSAELAASRL